jgi:hypothetical protein
MKPKSQNNCFDTSDISSIPGVLASLGKQQEHAQQAHNIWMFELVRTAGVTWLLHFASKCNGVYFVIQQPGAQAGLAWPADLAAMNPNAGSKPVLQAATIW